MGSNVLYRLWKEAFRRERRQTIPSTAESSRVALEAAEAKRARRRARNLRVLGQAAAPNAQRTTLGVG